ncbi:MAG: FAD:protein FMN transferase [Moraxellaceae bacterium]
MRGLLSVFLTLCVIAGCSSPEAPKAPVAASGIAFHSMQWQVKVSALPEGMDQAALASGLQGVLDEANAVLSTYQPDTELMRFNRAPGGEWVSVSPMLFSAVQTALEVSALTAGAYDITVGPLVNLWGFGPDAVPVKGPDVAALNAARARVGWQHIGVDAEKRALRRLADVQLDLSSLGEGVAVDAMAEWLETRGIKDFMVSVAGCTRVRGVKPDGQRWVIAIERADGSGQPERILALADNAVSTSGSYRNYHEIDGQRYSHTLDARTGMPITHRGVSASVIAADGNTTRADALATAFNVLGPEAGLALAARENIPVFYIERGEQGEQLRYTTAFSTFLKP